MSKWFGFHCASRSFLENFTLHSINVDLEQGEFDRGEREYFSADTVAEDAGAGSDNDSGNDSVQDVTPVLPEANVDEASLETYALNAATRRGRTKISAKSALASFRKGYVNFLQCTGSLTRDRVVWLDIAALRKIVTHIHGFHLNTIDQLQTPEGALKWNAQNATGAWKDHIYEMVWMMNDPETLCRLGVANINAPAGMPSSEQICNTLIQLQVEFLSERIFSMARRSTGPYQFSAICHQDTDKANVALADILLAWNAFARGQDYLEASTTPRPVQTQMRQLFRDVRYHRHQWCNEQIGLITNGGNTLPNRQVTYTVTGAFSRICNTKAFQEDTFGWLRHLQRSRNKNQEFARHEIQFAVDHTQKNMNDPRQYRLQQIDWETPLPAKVVGHSTQGLCQGIFNASKHKLSGFDKNDSFEKLLERNEKTCAKAGQHAPKRTITAIGLVKELHLSGNFANVASACFCVALSGKDFNVHGHCGGLRNLRGPADPSLT